MNTIFKPTAAGTCPPPPRFINHQEIEQLNLFDGATPETLDPRSNRDDLELFKRMNGYAWHMSRLWSRKRSLNATDRKRYLKWYSEYLRIRDVLTNRHVGLVYSLLQRCRFSSVEIDELRSEGLMALVRSIDSFNPWRGFRFSTYACNSILRAFSQAALRTRKRQHVWHTVGDHKSLDSTDWADQRYREHIEFLHERVQRAVADGRAELNDMERTILNARFLHPKDDKKPSLEELGSKLNLSKERVRQIQESSLIKLRQALLKDPQLNPAACAAG